MSSGSIPESFWRSGFPVLDFCLVFQMSAMLGLLTILVLPPAALSGGLSSSFSSLTSSFSLSLMVCMDKNGLMVLGACAVWLLACVLHSAGDENLVRPADNEIIIGSYDKIHKETGWEPRIKFNDSLADVINYWVDKMSNL